MAFDENGIPTDDAYGYDAAVGTGSHGGVVNDGDDVMWADIVPDQAAGDPDGFQAYGVADDELTYVYDGADQGDGAGVSSVVPVGDILASVADAADGELAAGEYHAESAADGYELYDADPAASSPAPDAMAQDGYQDMAQTSVVTRMPSLPAAYHQDSGNTKVAASVPDASVSWTDEDEDAESQAAIAALKLRRTKRRRRAIAISIVAVLVVAGGVAAFLLTRAGSSNMAEEAAVVLPTTEVVRKDFMSSVTSSGALQPMSSVTVTPPIEGTIAEMRVAEGDTVSKGDVLFVIKSEALDKAVNDATARLDRANTESTRAADAVAAAYDAYNQAVDGYNSGTISEAEINLLAANITSAEAARDAANAEVTAATTAVNDARAALDQCTVTAPTGGVVVAVHNDEPTASAAPLSYASVQIADVSQMKVTVQVNEMDISNVAVGQTARVTFSALPDIELNATVDSIAATATGASEDGTVPTGGVVTFGVTLLVAQPDPELKTGMTATVNIVTQDVPDALVVDLAAVDVDFTDPSVGSVVVVVNETTQETEMRAVRLGARDEQEVVVTEGLREGDVLLLAPVDDVLALDDEAFTA